MFFRVSLIEPGPVRSAIAGTVPAPLSDDSVDETTKHLFNNALEQTNTAFSQHSQSPRDIACIVLQAIEAQSPHFRYQTNAHYETLYASKFKDLSGDSTIELMTKLTSAV